MELLGPAFNSRSSVFLYGHPGNGKSSIARAAQTLLGGGVYMPYALVVDDQVVGSSTPATTSPSARRWPRPTSAVSGVKRPFVQVGGELDLVACST